MILEDLTSMIKLPRMVKVRQHFDRPMVEDLPGEIRRQMESSGVLERVKPGYRVALTAGSRQIAWMQAFHCPCYGQPRRSYR